MAGTTMDRTLPGRKGLKADAVGFVNGVVLGVAVLHRSGIGPSEWLAPLGIGSMVIYQMTPPEDTDQKGVKQIKLLARQYIPVPQKRQTANRKINGIGSKDRTVQAAQIAAAAAPGPVSPGALRAPVLPPFKTDPVAPSLGQSGFKLPSLPNYAKH